MRQRKEINSDERDTQSVGLTTLLVRYLTHRSNQNGLVWGTAGQRGNVSRALSSASSSLTIREALEAAREAGRQTPDTGLFERWLRAKGLSSRGSVLISRMREEYEQAFEERFSKGPVPIIIVQPADGRKLNRLFVERSKGGDAARRPITGLRNEGGSNPPSVPFSDHFGDANKMVSPDSIAALYDSGAASSLKEALAILGGGR